MPAQWDQVEPEEKSMPREALQNMWFALAGRMLLVIGCNAMLGCRALNQQSSFSNISGEFFPREQVGLLIIGADLITRERFASGDFRVKEARAWAANKEGLCCVWQTSETKCGQAIVIEVGCRSALEWIEAQGAIADRSGAVRGVFDARWELRSDTPSDWWELVNFSVRTPGAGDTHL